MPVYALDDLVPATVSQAGGLRQREWIAGAVKTCPAVAARHSAGARRGHL